MLDCQILMPRKRMRTVIVNPLENVMIFAKASKHRSLEIKALLKADIWIYPGIWLAVKLGNTLYHLEEILFDLPLSAWHSFLRFLFCFVFIKYIRNKYCCYQARSRLFQNVRNTVPFVHVFFSYELADCTTDAGTQEDSTKISPHTRHCQNQVFSFH